MHRRHSRSARHWKLTAIGMAIVLLTALAAGLIVAAWSARTTEVQPAALPAPVAELPPRAEPIAAPAAATDPLAVAPR